MIPAAESPALSEIVKKSAGASPAWASGRRKHGAPVKRYSLGNAAGSNAG